MQGAEIWLVKKSDELATGDSGLVAEEARATPIESAQSDPHCEQEAVPGLGCRDVPGKAVLAESSWSRATPGTWSLFS